jgi:chromosome segregation ATPase
LQEINMLPRAFGVVPVAIVQSCTHVCARACKPRIVHVSDAFVVNPSTVHAVQGTCSQLEEPAVNGEAAAQKLEAAAQKAEAAAQKAEAERRATNVELAAVKQQLGRLVEDAKASSSKVKQARQQHGAALQKLQRMEQRCRGLSGEVTSLGAQLQVRM